MDEIAQSFVAFYAASKLRYLVSLASAYTM